MPIYEFFHQQKEDLLLLCSSSDYANKIPLCPDGKQFKMMKLLSGFSITGQRSDAEPESPTL